MYRGEGVELKRELSGGYGIKRGIEENDLWTEKGTE